MNYAEFVPPPELADYIKCFWILEDDHPQTDHAERVLPDGCMELIFHFGENFKQYFEEKVEVQPASFLFGQLTRFIRIGPSGKTGIIAARFYPHGANPFFNFLISEITDTAVDIRSLFGNEGAELEERIITARNNQTRLQLLQQFLITKLRQHQKEDHLVANCIKEIADAKGVLSIDLLSQNLNISQRQLERRFISTVGLNPKYLSRIIRFNNIFKLIEKKEINSLTVLCYEGGYYDQAHFIRDFKQFTGLSPKTYFAQDNHLANLFT